MYTALWPRLSRLRETGLRLGLTFSLVAFHVSFYQASLGLPWERLTAGQHLWTVQEELAEQG